MSKCGASGGGIRFHRDLTAATAMHGVEDGKKFMPARLADL